jgi:hypothetical protein
MRIPSALPLIVMLSSGLRIEDVFAAEHNHAEGDGSGSDMGNTNRQLWSEENELEESDHPVGINKALKIWKNNEFANSTFPLCSFCSFSFIGSRRHTESTLSRSIIFMGKARRRRRVTKDTIMATT